MVLGVGKIDTISKDFSKIWEKLDRNLDPESVWSGDIYWICVDIGVETCIDSGDKGGSLVYLRSFQILNKEKGVKDPVSICKIRGKNIFFTCSLKS